MAWISSSARSNVAARRGGDTKSRASNSCMEKYGRKRFPTPLCFFVKQLRHRAFEGASLFMCRARSSVWKGPRAGKAIVVKHSSDHIVPLSEKLLGVAEKAFHGDMSAPCTACIADLGRDKEHTVGYKVWDKLCLHKGKLCLPLADYINDSSHDLPHTCTLSPGLRKSRSCAISRPDCSHKASSRILLP